MNTVQKTAPRPGRSAQRDAVLAAATQILEAEGWRAITARRLAEAAGCSLGQIYNLFPGTEAVLQALNLETLRALDAALAGTRPERPLAALARAYLNFTIAHRPRWAAVLEVSGAGDAELDAAVTALVARLDAALAPLCPDPDRRRRHAATLWTALEGIVGLASSGNAARLTDADPSTLAETLVTTYEAGLRRSGA
ncbi:TetR/AcrR family transcriptional regulator [Roseomonas sp. CCTCC AB2023176]|uniref:TetR/AcrR family transcriptional regulator n=1 Tax=Roseomonas sp. CCTCC AB2023176 TaxID=3342640 RepID=UPI0035DEC439